MNALLTRAAEERGLSRSELIRQQLALVLEQYRRHPRPRAAGIIRRRLAEVDYFLRKGRDAMGALVRDLSRGAFTYAASTLSLLERAMDIDREYADLGLGLVALRRYGITKPSKNRGCKRTSAGTGKGKPTTTALPCTRSCAVQSAVQTLAAGTISVASSPITLWLRFQLFARLFFVRL